MSIVAQLRNSKSGEILTMHKPSDVPAAKFDKAVLNARTYCRAQFGIVTVIEGKTGDSYFVRVLAGHDKPLTEAEADYLKAKRPETIKEFFANRNATPTAGEPHVIKLPPQSPKAAQTSFYAKSRRAQMTFPEPIKQTPAAPVEAPTSEAPESESAPLAGFWREVFLAAMRSRPGASMDYYANCAREAVSLFNARFSDQPAL